MMDWTSGNMTAGGWLVMILLIALLLAGLAAIGYWMVRVVSDHSAPQEKRTHDPRRLLDERLARGDIDDEDYRRRRDLLEQGR